jgi:cell division transport system permease protein
MRASFVFSEVLTGLRRNVTMTVAMILTTAISLGLLGGGLLVVRTIGKMQDIYLSKLQVSVDLTADVSSNDPNCGGAICAGLRQQLVNTPGVKDVQFESQGAAYTRYRQMFAAMPQMIELGRPGALPASLHVEMDDPSRSDVIVQEFTGKLGVKDVNNEGVFLQKLINVLNGVRNATFVIAVIQALAALLLISNTIQVSAFTRRNEVGIMRLVGATRWYTQLPFLLEAVTFLDSALAPLTSSGVIPQIQLADVGIVSPWLLITAIGISALTGYVTLRMYVRL